MRNLSDRFFKDRYMFAIYDLEDRFIEVCDNAQELASFINKKTRYLWQLSPSQKDISKNGIVEIGNIKIHLIDIYPSKHKDCFTECEKDFVRRVVKNRDKNIIEIMNKYGMSRKKAQELKRIEKREYLLYRQRSGQVCCKSDDRVL